MAIFRNNSAYQSWQAPARPRGLRLLVTVRYDRYRIASPLVLSPKSRLFGDPALSDIRADYGMMLTNGATSTWETIKGREDFLNAGSLCHAWTATPIYIFHKLGMVK